MGTSASTNLCVFSGLIGARAGNGVTTPGGNTGGGLAVSPTSCSGLPKTCGSSRPDDCCASSIVPAGSFIRDNGVTGNYPATVSAFRLDKYEVTVGRFRKFLAAYPGSQPAAGSGV